MDGRAMGGIQGPKGVEEMTLGGIWARRRVDQMAMGGLKGLRGWIERQGHGNGHKGRCRHGRRLPRLLHKVWDFGVGDLQLAHTGLSSCNTHAV